MLYKISIMKILMFGRGVITTLYGWALEGAGHTVDFYVRPGRAAGLGSIVQLDIYDLRIKETAAQHIKANWAVKLREDLPEKHDYDLIIVSVTHYRFEGVASFLEKRAGNATILILNNFWDEPLAEAKKLPQNQLAWGFPAAGGGFQNDDKLYGALFPKMEFGTFGNEPSKREIAVRKLFSEAGFKFEEHKNFREWLWVHFAISAAVTAEQFRSGGSRMDIYENKNGSMEEAVRAIREIMPVLSARGININEHPELTFFNQPEPEVASAIVKLISGRAFKAAIEGHANPEELLHMFDDVLAEGTRLGIALPRFESAKHMKY